MDIQADLADSVAGKSRTPVCAAAKTVPSSGSRTSTAETAADRLYRTGKVAEQRLETQRLAKQIATESTVMSKPTISPGSKKLLAGRPHLPIYSNERIEQIKKKTKAALQRERDKERATEYATAPVQPKVGSDSVALLRSKGYAGTHLLEAKRQVPHETTEEAEYRRNCTFRPRTNRSAVQQSAKVAVSIIMSR